MQEGGSGLYNLYKIISENCPLRKTVFKVTAKGLYCDDRVTHGVINGTFETNKPHFTVSHLYRCPSLMPARTSLYHGIRSRPPMTPGSRPSRSERPAFPGRSSSPQFRSSCRSPYTNHVVVISGASPSDQPQALTGSSLTSKMYAGTCRLLSAALMAERIDSSKGESSLCPARILMNSGTRSFLS